MAVRVLILAFVLAGCATVPTERDILCDGPVAVIPDDDPGLALFADVIAASGVEAAKFRLALTRASSCDDMEVHNG